MLPRYGTLRDPRTRRQFFRLASLTAAGGSVAFLGACGDDDDDGSARTGTAEEPGTEGDIATLNAALDLENTAVAAYTAGLGQLRGRARTLAEQLLEQEREHVAFLKQAVEDLGGRPSRPKSRDLYAEGFPELRNQREALRFAVDLEQTAVAAYIDAQAKLSKSELRGSVSAIGTNEAEHLSVLLGALGANPVPEAFVTGKGSS